MSDRIYSHRDLIVCQKSFVAGRRVFELSKQFLRQEMYSLTDQVRRSSRSVSANVSEAWRRRRYEKHFRSSLNIAEAEAAETHVWLEYAAAHGYLDKQTAAKANQYYDEILRMIVAMIHGSASWYDLKKRTGDGKSGKSGSRGVRESGSGGVRESGSGYWSNSQQCVIDQLRLLCLGPDLPDFPAPDRKGGADDA